MTAERSRSSKNIQISLFLSLLVLICNLFLKVNVIGDSHLLLGSTFVFLGMLLLPMAFVLPIVLCTLITLILDGASSAILIMTCIEFLTIAYLRQKNLVLLVSSILYWLFIGMPVLWLIQYYYMSDLSGTGLILTLKSAFNGLLNVACASTIFAALPASIMNVRRVHQHSLSTNIFNTSANTLLLPLLIVLFILVKQSVTATEMSISEDLKSKSKVISLHTTNFLLKHKVIIEQLASLNSAPLTEKQYQSLMIKAQSDTPTFFNITTTDNQGNLKLFAPARFYEQLKDIAPTLRTVKDRKYYREPRQTGLSYVSNGIKSRGIIKGSMIAISAPLVNGDNFDGILFGAINLAGVNELKEEIANISKDKTLVITDRDNQLLYSNSPELLSTLVPFNYSSKTSKIINNVSLLQMNNTDYVYGKDTNEYGWNIYVLEDSSAVSHSIREQFLFASLGIALVITLFLFFAYRLSHKITAPLVSLLHDESSFSATEFESQTTSREILDMAKKLKRSSYLMRNYENRLKLQVEEKTEQLEQLNLLLAAQAREDGLTGLYNRSGFNELAINAIKTSYRLKQTFSVVLLDLDNFKNINDTYGHALGDKCLVAFAELMQSFCKRDTDIIGRYGGEEFVIYMSGSNINSQHKIIEEIHRHTRLISVLDETSNTMVGFTASIGVCTVLSPVNLTLTELINISDEELYKCKRSGRDKVSIRLIGE